MCCMFTCCGWMVDLIQRFWTFIMSCCISSAICCMLITASMSGVALGYNYSLAEYMDLKETNVSVFMRRGIFDDEMADVEFRRSGDTSEKNLQNALLEESTPFLRSGRRLDDSVFETGDQHRYEGNLMKLTARPAYVSTSLPSITNDLEMANIATSYEKNSLDSLKAVQGLIDARRSMANRLSGGTTISPVPTYPFNEAERLYHNADRRRVMPNIDYKANTGINPARLGVPDANIGSRVNWQAPKNPEAFRKIIKDYGLEQEPITYPSPVPFNTGPLRPTPTSSTPGRDAIFLTRVEPFPFFSTAATTATDITKPLSVESFKENLLLENEMVPRKKINIKSDDEYDYDVKGLPVKKRRSIESDMPVDNDKYDDKKSVINNNDHNMLSNHILIKMSSFIPKTNRIIKKKTSYVDRLEINNQLTSNEGNKDTKVENKVETPITQQFNEIVYGNNIIGQLLLKLKNMKKTFFESSQTVNTTSEEKNQIINLEITNNYNTSEILLRDIALDTKSPINISKNHSDFVDISKNIKTLLQVTSSPLSPLLKSLLLKI